MLTITLRKSLLSKSLLVLVCLWAGQLFASPAILVTGDSLSAAYGIPLEKGWVALLQTRLQEEGYPHRVINTSVSGETTAGGLARLPQALEKHRPSIVILELGANDGLRGLPLAEMRANLEQMVKLSQAAGAEVLLLGMRLPSNYGPVYTEAFREGFGQVAESSGVALIPFFLERIALDQKWFQADGIHPTEAAQPMLLGAVWEQLATMLDKGTTQ